ncbi:unnamed protein product, partial [Darwinula stevensoni]
MAHEAAAAQHYPTSSLYVVATPIGNLADMSLRALYVLQLADTIACEDTRHSQALLQHYGLYGKKLLALHQHNEEQAAQDLILRLKAGERVAYISDAGTPAISDPGARLVRAVRQAGHRCVPLPGASSITTLMSAAGAVSESVQGAAQAGFAFCGFLPSKSQERQTAIARMAEQSGAQMWLESPHRIVASSQDLQKLGIRQLTVGRELTKQHEEIVTIPAQDLHSWLQANPQRQRGEYTLLLHPVNAKGDFAQNQKLAAQETLKETLILLLPHMPLKSAVALAGKLHPDITRNDLYQIGLELKKTLSTEQPTPQSLP